MNHPVAYEKTNKTPVLERLMRHVLPEPNTGCWLWMGTVVGEKYGQVRARVGKVWKMRVAHLVMYETVVGPVPEGLELDHKCTVKSCVNPNHLEPVTHSVNVKRGTSGDAVRRRAALITHCPHGHEYTPDNTRHTVRKDGSKNRYCVACRKDHWHAVGKHQRRERILRCA